MKPYQIEHLVQRVVGPTGDVEQIYNFLIYRFEGFGAHVWARTYLDAAHTASIHGPFRSAVDLTPVENSGLMSGVVAYLGERFSRLERCGPDGYVPIP